jgi:hypothetical protein
MLEDELLLVEEPSRQERGLQAAESRSERKRIEFPKHTRWVDFSVA